MTSKRGRAAAAAIAAEALTWIGTPFVWGQSQKGRGCDCKGLVAGVARECGRPEATSWAATFASYRPDRPVPSTVLLEGMAAVFDPVGLNADQLADGDVLLLAIGARPSPSHLAIVAGDRAVHAWISPRERVRATPLAALLKTCRLHSAWRWRILSTKRGKTDDV